MAFDQNIQVLNPSSYDRNGFVTLGIPCPSGTLFSGDPLVVDGATSQRENVQWHVQGPFWADGSVKYAKATFPVHTSPNEEKEVIVSRSFTQGVTSSFIVPVEADIQATRIEFSFIPKDFRVPFIEITGWEATTINLLGRDANGDPIPIPRSATRVRFTSLDLRVRENFIGSEYRENALGYYRGGAGGFSFYDTSANVFFVQLSLQGYSTLGPYAGTLVAIRETNNSIIVVAHSPDYFTGGLYGPPSIGGGRQNVSIGIWHPTTYMRGYLNFDLSDATLIEEISGTEEVKSHRKRYRLFRRGNNAVGNWGLPRSIWGEVIYDKYKGSDTIDLWFSWGNSFCEPNRGTVGGTEPQYTFYYDQDILLKFFSNSGGATKNPRVAAQGGLYHFVRGPVNQGTINQYTLLDTNYQPTFTSNAGAVQKKICPESLPHGISFGYKFKVVYTNSLSSSNNADLFGDTHGGEQHASEIVAMADWNGKMPPFRNYVPIPPRYASLTAAKTSFRAQIDYYENNGYKPHQPMWINAAMMFMGNTRPSMQGGQGLIFNAIPGSWMIATQDPYPIRLMMICMRHELRRPFRKIDVNGKTIRFRDYVNNQTEAIRWPYTYKGFIADNGDDYMGLGRSVYNTSTGPAPALQAIFNRQGPTRMDTVHAIVPDGAYQGGIAEEQGEPVTGYQRSHFSPDYVMFMFMITMDPLLEKQCEVIKAALFTEMWSGFRSGGGGGVDPGSARSFTREESRPIWAAVKLMEVANDLEHIEETKAKVRRIEYGYVGTVANQRGHVGFVVADLYGSGNYDTKRYGYAIGDPPPDGSLLLQEWADEPWLDLMGGVHFWAGYKVLSEHTGAAHEAQICKRVTTDLAATTLLNDFWSSDEHTEVFFDFNDWATINQARPNIVIGDVIESEGNPNNYGTVLLAEYLDLTSYSTDTIPWTQAGSARMQLKLHIINRVGGPFSQYVKVRRTGQRLKTFGGGDLPIIRQFDGFKCSYVGATSPRTSDTNTINWTGGMAPNYFGRQTMEERYGTAIDYVHNPNYTQWVPYKVGTEIKPYTSGISRYAYHDDGVFIWGVGICSVALKLAEENAFGAHTAAVRARAQSGYGYHVSSVWNGNPSDVIKGDFCQSNLFIEQADTSATNVFFRQSSPLPLLITEIQANASGQRNYTKIDVRYSGQSPIPLLAYSEIDPTTIYAGTGAVYVVHGASIKTNLIDPSISITASDFNAVTVRPGTINLYTNLLTPNPHGSSDNVLIILADLAEPTITVKAIPPQAITATTVFSSTFSGTVIDLIASSEPLAVFNQQNKTTGSVYWRRSVALSLPYTEYAGTSDWDGIPGTYGSPQNKGDDVAFGTNLGGEGAWLKEYGQGYFSEDDIINILGYPEGQTILSPGYKAGFWDYMYYYEYLQYGYEHYDVTAQPISPEDVQLD